MVIEVCPVQNKNFERAHDRYVIEKSDFEKIDKKVWERLERNFYYYHFDFYKSENYLTFKENLCDISKS